MKRAYHNPDPTSDLPEGAPRDVVNAEFAKRLQHHLTRKGWNQSELARRAQEKMPGDGKIGRDSISAYIRGRVLPGPVKLKAVAAALGVEPGDLIPRRGLPAAADRNPPFDMRKMDDGNIWLKVNQGVSFKTALAVAELIRQDEETRLAKEG